MKKTNVLNHSSKNWLVAMVAICGFMFLGAFSSTAQSYVDADVAKHRVDMYQQEQDKGESTSPRVGNLKITRTELTPDHLQDYARKKVAETFFKSLTGQSAQDVANTLQTLGAQYNAIQNGTAINVALLRAHNDFERFLRI